MNHKLHIHYSLLLSKLTVGLFLCFFINGVMADETASQWAGFYAGGEAGLGYSDFDWQHQNANYFNTLGATLLGTDFENNDTGAMGGIFAGYNYPVDLWVLGLEITASATDIKQSQQNPFFITDAITSELDWITTVTGRAGYSWNRWLFYAKGGWAGGGVELTFDDTAAAVTANSDEFAYGWTTGVGAEYKLYDNVSLGVVYDYLDLGIDDESINCPNCGVGVGFGTPIVDGDIRSHSIMGRITIQFSR